MFTLRYLIKLILLYSLFAVSTLCASTNLLTEQLKAGQRTDGSIHAWIYFTDKGVGPLNSVLNRVQLCERSIVRRQKVRPVNPVTFRDIPLVADYVQAVRNSGADLRVRSRWLNAVSVAASLEQLDELARLSFVEQIKPVLGSYRSIEPAQELPPFSVARIQPVDLDYGYAQAQIEQINTHTAHNNGYYGQGVRVLMVDTGYNLAHTVFDSLDIVATWDFINSDSVVENQAGDYYSQHNHGTYTFSALGGYAPGELIGPAFGAQFLLAKTEIVDQEIQWEEDLYVAALEWGDSLGADVVSSSLGYLDWYTYEDMDGNTAITTNAIDYAVSIGIVCVTAAGNEAGSAWNYIIAPADADSVIAVGAVDADGIIASFSSRGPTYDGRIKPEVCARGVATACASATGSGYVSVPGTSLSTPLVAGAAAIVLSAHPEWTPIQVREALMMTADQADHPDTAYGYGIIDVWAAINFTNFDTTDPEELPQKFGLLPAYPNPFNPATNLTIHLDQDGVITLEIINLRGQLVTALRHEWLTAGEYTIQWNGSNYSSGIYFARLKQGDQTETRKLILIK
ncbi:MAG: S8 family serine peptidase [Candidatus Marinimicrobia bacterium]|nr:S8 family serine peptidase [Candidatus Neomarinimicrobiota bacterium]